MLTSLGEYMNPIKLWEIAMSTKLHFTSESYDAYKYHFTNKRLTRSAFDKARDKFFYIRLARHLDNETEARRFVFANILYDDVYWIGDMSLETFQAYSKNIQTLGYRYKADLAKSLSGTLDEFLTAYNKEYPKALTMYMMGAIMTETIIILHHFTSFLDQAIADTLLWPDLRKKFIKSVPFLLDDINISRMKQISLSCLQR